MTIPLHRVCRLMAPCIINTPPSARHLLSGRAMPLLAALLLLFAAANAVKAETYGDIQVVFNNSIDANTTVGYAEYLVTVRNTSTDRDRLVTLSIPGDTWGGGGPRISRLSRTVEVPAGATVEVPLLQPALEMPGSGISVSIDGERQDRYVGLNTSSHSSWDGYYDNGNAILCGQGIRGDDIDDFSDGFDYAIGYSGYYNSPFYLSRSEITVAGWSPRWLAYTRFAAVMVSPQELDAMPEPVRAAIDAYTHCGGTLVILGDFTPPDGWGVGASIENRESHQPLPDVSQYAHGLGQRLVMARRTLRAWDEYQWDAFVRTLEQSRVQQGFQLTPSEANSSFPVIEDQGIPARGLLFMMVLFAILIGPVNLIVLHKLRRRLWTLWTVPAMSLLFSATVFGYAMLSEGWGAVGRSMSVTVLDETTMLASTVGIQAYYCPLTPGDGLHFDRGTEITPQIAYDYDYRATDSSPRTLDWTHDQHLASGWISSRVPAHFMIRKSETRRERLNFSRHDDGSYSVVNGLGAPITDLFVADSTGQVYTAGPIAPGASATLTRAPSSPAYGSGQGLIYYVRRTGPWNGLQRIAGDGPGNFDLSPGTYYALLEGTPFMEIGLSELSEHRSTSAVIGLMQEPLDGN
ncbi:MAG: hypothetical protein ACIAXF_14845 [Phycisphaerales bacterium JB063]